MVFAQINLKDSREGSTRRYIAEVGMQNPGKNMISSPLGSEDKLTTFKRKTVKQWTDKLIDT